MNGVTVDSDGIVRFEGPMARLMMRAVRDGVSAGRMTNGTLCRAEITDSTVVLRMNGSCLVLSRDEIRGPGGIA